MAIDTLAKRVSVLTVSTVILPIPDGTVGQDDRQTLLKTYGGILAGAVVAGVASVIHNISISLGIRL